MARHRQAKVAQTQGFEGQQEETAFWQQWWQGRGGEYLNNTVKVLGQFLIARQLMFITQLIPAIYCMLFLSWEAKLGNRISFLFEIKLDLVTFSPIKHTLLMALISKYVMQNRSCPIFSRPNTGLVY